MPDLRPVLDQEIMAQGTWKKGQEGMGREPSTNPIKP